MGIFTMAVLLLRPTLTAAGVYDRPLHMVYALPTGKGLPYNDTQFLNHWDKVDPPITAMVPFLLNVKNPSQYESIIDSLANRSIIIVPAVGGSPSDSDIDTQANYDIASGYKPYSDYIRLENLQGFYEDYGSTGIQNMIDYCVSAGFKHIMMNPWPTDGSNTVPLNCSICDAGFYQVLLDYNHTTYEPILNSSNWYPGNQNKISHVRAYQPGIEILINYESPPQQDVLTTIETNSAGASESAMQITINEIEGQYASEDLHWCPPMTESYDPIALGTWKWIAGKLSSM